MISLKALIQTDANHVYLFLRLVAGIIIFPYGMQKLFGWFDGKGIRGTMDDMKERNMPKFIGVLVIIGQSFGSIALIIGFLGRIAAGGLFVIFAGALVTHAKDGWMMNWFGKKKGEGIEYFVLLLAILAIIIFMGSGPLSVDFWLQGEL